MRVRYGLVTIVWLATNVLLPPAARADDTGHVVISELETGTTLSASNEFIELYNPSATSVPVDGWSLEHKSATSVNDPGSWTKRASLTGAIPAYGFYLVAPRNYLVDADADWTPTLAASGGSVRLKDDSGAVVDLLGYGSANTAEGGAAAPAPAAGQSLERLPGRLNELGGNDTDTESNAADFLVRLSPQPQNQLSPAELPLGVGGVPDAAQVEVPELSSEGDASSESPPAYAPVEITELLVNPMAPLTDSHDEFIELYNPGEEPVDLAGYVLRTGSGFHQYYVLPEQVLSPGGYMAVTSAQTKLSLVNGGGAVEILDPEGNLVDVTPPYETAPEGQSWARFGDGWHWTLQTTPGLPNVLAAISLPALSVVKSAHTTASKAVAKKTTKATGASKKASAKTATRKVRAKAPKSAKKTPVQIAAARNFQPERWLLIGLAILTIGYAIYEFRFDIQNIYHRLRSDPAPRRGDRPSSQRGDDG